MKCVQCGGEINHPESVAGMLFCGTTCMTGWYREHWWKCKEIWKFYLQQPEKFIGLTYQRNDLISKARRKYWDKRKGFDKTEEIIQNMYKYQPKRMNLALEKHRQGKFKRQIQAEQQFAQYQATKKEAENLKQKYRISPEKNERMKAEFQLK